MTQYIMHLLLQYHSLKVIFRFITFTSSIVVSCITTRAPSYLSESGSEKYLWTPLKIFSFRIVALICVAQINNYCLGAQMPRNADNQVCLDRCLKNMIKSSGSRRHWTHTNLEHRQIQLAVKSHDTFHSRMDQLLVYYSLRL